jgi:hypothetical protein
MTTGQWILLIVVVAVIVVLVALLARRRGRRKQLRDQFGPEYERAVAERGDVKAAESDLLDRRRRREQLEIRPLSPEAQTRYAEEWRLIQLRFVDNPDATIGDADRLVTQVMRDRGYPIEDFERRAADLSVDHPTVVENYRMGHATAEAHAAGKATTEDLRQAVIHYRALFEQLLGGDDTARRGEVS